MGSRGETRGNLLTPHSTLHTSLTLLRLMVWQGGFDLGLNCCVAQVSGKTRPYNRTPELNTPGSTVRYSP
jgi:hypothetical protein